jgi:aminoglycoside phosphotransferase (APT) family kinase protein
VESGGGQTLVHGDYGPNNVLVDPQTLAVVAVVDWE